MKKEEVGIKFDGQKNRWDLVPFDTLDEVVKRFTHGAVKYSDNNWKNVNPERYKAALMRHFSSYMQGEEMDPDCPELTHIGAVAWNSLILLYFQLHKEDSNKK